MTDKEILDLILSCACSEGDICIDELPEEFDVVEEGDWGIDYKDYASCVNIVTHKPSKTFWSIYRNRSGSYYTDYYYGESDVCRVEPAQRIENYWKVIPLESNTGS